MPKSYDVVIIGAGAVGCAVARELSRYKLNIAVTEKENDVASGTSGRNSAVVHSGFNNKVGSLMAKLCVEGNGGFEQLCKDLDVPYRKTGKLLVAFDNEDMQTLERLVVQGRENGCKGIRLVDKTELTKIAKNVGGIGGMISPETAIFDPFTYCVALAENAKANGVDFFFESKVTGISKDKAGFLINAGENIFSAKFIINCAGLYSDKISEMAGVGGYHIYPCRGEYFILDKIAEKLMPIPVYPAPKAGIGGLGVHITPTIDGNLIIGPSAEYIDAPDDYACTKPVMDNLFAEAKQLLPTIEKKHIIGNYSGIRPKQAPSNEGGFRDFVIKEEDACPGLINLIGIESPGLTASIPIAKRVCEIIRGKLAPAENTEFIQTRNGILRFREQSAKRQAQLIKENPEYGEIVCRCQKITKKEIRQAIENPLGVCSLSAIKYRAWATTGRCNGGYCLMKIVDILVREYGIKPENITYRSKGSEMFSGEVK